MRTKKLVAGLLAMAMVVSGLAIAPKDVDAAAVTSVVYEEVTDIAGAKAMIGVSAPVFGGIEEGFALDENYDLAGAVDLTADYLFGGWYVYYYESSTDEAAEWVKVSAASELAWFVDEKDSDGNDGPDGWDDATGSTLCIKWVPASILSVKAQVTDGTTKDSSTTNARVISSVDSLDYQSVGFEIELNNKTSVKTDEGGALTTTKVYDKLTVSSTTSYSASQIFGEAASHFVVWRLAGIEKANFEKIIYVKPYWVTADGMTVYGLPKYVHVEDSYNKYISVPINLRDIDVTVDDVTGIAAGVVEISYPAALTLVKDKVEVGRVFDEMEFADKDGTVKFAANVSDIGTNETKDDIYVNLRFTTTDDVKYTEYDFEIQGEEDFCNNDEAKVTINVWDVLY